MFGLEILGPFLGFTWFWSQFGLFSRMGWALIRGPLGVFGGSSYRGRVSWPEPFAWVKFGSTFFSRGAFYTRARRENYPRWTPLKREIKPGVFQGRVIPKRCGDTHKRTTNKGGDLNAGGAGKTTRCW